jgi:hypothetical protein
MSALPGGAVRINPEGTGYDANSLEQMRVKHVVVDMAKASADIRRQHVEHLKMQKQLAAGMPSIEAYWASLVGERNAKDAMVILHNEAAAEIAREAAEATFAAMAKRKS